MPKPTTLTFRDLFDTWIQFLEAEEKSPRTIESYSWTVKQFVKYCELEGISPDTLTVKHTSAFNKEVKKRPGVRKSKNGDPQRISPGGVFAIMKDTRSFLNWCFDKNLLDQKIAVPVPKQPKPKIPRLKTEAEREAFLMATEQGRNSFRDHTLVYFMLETGLRNAEVRDANWGDLFTNGEYRMPKIKVPHGKGDKSRTVPMPHEVYIWLNHLKSDIEEEFGPGAVADNMPIFLKENGKRMSKYTLKMLFTRLSERAAKRLDRDDFWITPHMLRHTYGRTMVLRGLPLPALQQYMGHADIKTTMIYASLDDGDELDKVYLKVMQNAA